MTCHGCHIARTEKVAHMYYMGCLGCEARSMLRSDSFQQSHKAGKMTPQYQLDMLRLFGDDWRDWHKVVKEWQQLLEEADSARQPAASTAASTAAD